MTLRFLRSIAPTRRFATQIACAAAVVIPLSACTPKYDWREVRGTDTPFTVLLPAKPSTYTRPVNLGGIKANMTMTAAEIDDVTFAVGTAELPDTAQAQAALLAMKETLVKNINGVVRQEKTQLGSTRSTIELEAGPGAAQSAASKTGGDKEIALHARFFARDRRVYQVIVAGRERAIRPESVDTFLTSFKID